MVGFLIENWQFFVGMITSGGLSSILTMKIGVKSAKTSLMQQLQTLYQGIINDLRTDVDYLRGEMDKNKTKICYRDNCKTRIK
ncbi:MAG: hypothetical protein LBN27_11095 [Prevotellaceae bacterium]|jgi:hypothetical protein|nr:hypothetical protein [Prevotellaceae bacterium]